VSDVVYTMTTEDVGAGPSTEFLTSNVDFATRTIFVGDIDAESTTAFIKAMHLLAAQSADHINIIMFSAGGLVYGALAMYDAIRSVDTVVQIDVFGACMSAAVIVVQACDRRFIRKHATVMVHNGSTGVDGDPLTVAAWGKQAHLDLKLMHQLLAKGSGKTEAYWKRKCAKGDYILTADQAQQQGLFDEVISGDEEE